MFNNQNRHLKQQASKVIVVGVNEMQTNTLSVKYDNHPTEVMGRNELDKLFKFNIN